MFKTRNYQQYCISRSCAEGKDVLTGKMTHCLWLVMDHKKPEGSVESQRELSIHPEKKTHTHKKNSLCYMSYKD